jgi:hypothetical protein
VAEQIAQTSIYLNEEDRRIVQELQDRTGLARSALVRLAIQRMYQGEQSDRSARLLAISEELKSLA